MSTVIEVENTVPDQINRYSTANRVTGNTAAITPGLASRTAVLIYSLTSYALGMTGLIWLILAMGGLVPYGFGPVHTVSPVTAILVDMGLIFLFGLQHTIMARRTFKEKITLLIPKAAERSTFVLASGMVMCLAVWCWQSVPGTVWSVESTAAKFVLWGFYLAGWTYLVVSTFVTNHFELFGLRQAYLYFRGIPYTPVKFINKWMYSYSRHPMMLGVLVGLWSIPVMSASHFFLSLLLTAYIAVGVLFEERGLINEFGDTYREYKRSIGTFFTLSK